MLKFNIASDRLRTTLLSYFISYFLGFTVIMVKKYNNVLYVALLAWSVLKKGF